MGGPDFFVGFEIFAGNFFSEMVLGKFFSRRNFFREFRENGFVTGIFFCLNSY